MGSFDDFTFKSQDLDTSLHIHNMSLRSVPSAGSEHLSTAKPRLRSVPLSTTRQVSGSRASRVPSME